MKTKYFFLAALAATALVSCTSDDFVGDNSPDIVETKASEAIGFGFQLPNVTRADIGGQAAAELLGYNFYVTGTKGEEAATSPTPNLVFDNYLVNYAPNTAGTTESNTANWEYVGVTPGTAPYENYVKLSALNTQTIKYWDYSVPQYDFLAFSTGTYKAVDEETATGADDEIVVTPMLYGTALASSAIAYTFVIPSVEAIQNTFISDITEVTKANYGQDVTLRFKNLGSKVRVALYETVPGYSVKDVVFYKEDGTTDFTGTKSTTAALISESGIPTSGTISVYFPHVGNENDDAQDYNIAAAEVAVGSTAETSPTFGALDNFQGPDGDEDEDDYLGRTLPQATFAGSSDAQYYQAVFPVSDSEPLTLRVDYTLVSTDGSGEEINIYGAKAVVPSTYTVWLPNYAYTYIFKISDNTNGWTSPDAATDGTDPGLFPITFDAVVAEATDATGEQTTVTTVATPSITTYQQNHAYTTNEYSIATDKNIYVQVMDNSTTPATLVTNLSATNSLLYAIDDDNADTATEAMVMDALQKRTTELTAANVTGRNGITLTKNANIKNDVEEIVNGVDDNPIEIEASEAAEIAIAELTAGTYAYVYDYTTGDKTTVIEYQPIVATGNLPTDAESYHTVTTAYLDGITAVTDIDEEVDNAYIYFSKTTNGTATATYSYISVAGKKTLPAGLIKVKKSDITTSQDGGTPVVEGTFYFDRYIVNDGKYAVKVIKIVA